MWRTDFLEKTLVLEKIEGGRRRGQQRMRWLDNILALWTWVWVSPGSWWWTGKPGVLWSMGLQTVGHNWVTELNWTDSCTSRTPLNLCYLSPLITLIPLVINCIVLNFPSRLVSYILSITISPAPSMVWANRWCSTSWTYYRVFKALAVSQYHNPELTNYRLIAESRRTVNCNSLNNKSVKHCFSKGKIINMIHGKKGSLRTQYFIF